ncbi:MAG TPA: rhomboid family intramembrane serine protease [Cyclobacteriaceae bacterium]|nr:rhomboid family intramembrane serine protease [Cyclobacteriaceae bacterium]HNC12357.1 rhomboid family intramembrane serine protease [Cyclobacteriaceae bacterium]HND44113.1 rhomboid family intramembrane serine protease [Cyclobacteriaceae bacterium]HNF79918.1 rhomboid family intramembrane serine protease [Cyclobacteriaceae bacterium]HNG43948.1 rhomboid family intramembrane serine protease [Cyclobacteriaceae bacterium]
MKDKIKIIFVPTILALLALILGYTFLNWFLFIKLELFGLREIITNFGLPAILTGLTAWILLRPRFKMLALESQKGNWRDFYSFILWIILTIPLMIAQEYIITASGKLTELNSINDIHTAEPTRYYTVKNYYIHKKAISIHSAFEVTGKHNDNFHMYIYVAVPMLAKQADTTSTECSAWLGLQYHENISNRLKPSEKERRYQEFAAKSQRDFEKEDVSRFVYLDRIGNSDKKQGLLEAIKKNRQFNGDQIILVPVSEPFEARNGNKLAWIFGSSLVGLSVWLVMLLIPKINEFQLKRIKKGAPDKEAREEMNDFIELLKPREGYFITPILIYINIGIYILMVLSGLGFISFKTVDLLNWGANYGPLTKGGDWWRLLTNVFLHGGLMHVLMNTFGLLFVGVFIEPLLGKAKFIMVYLLTGILASVASIAWYEATVSIGASGAIFGLYGLFLAFMLTKIFPPAFSKAFLVSTLVFVGYNLLFGLLGGIDNAAHIGGLLSGFVIGLLLYPQIKKRAVNESAEPEMLG